MNLFNILLEAIDNPNLDDVEKFKLSYRIIYTFVDTESEKAVEAYKETGVPAKYEVSLNFDDQIYLARELSEIDPSLRFYDAVDAEDAKATTAEVFLRGLSGYSITNLNNWTFVYNKLAGVIIDAVQNEGINALSFSGSAIGMDIIYIKLMERFNKTLSDDKKFVQISETAWVQKHVLDNADDSKEYGVFSAKYLLNASYQAFQGYAGEYMKQYKVQRKAKERSRSEFI